MHCDVRRAALLAALALGTLSCGCGAGAVSTAAPGPPPSTLPLSRSSHVVVIVMENKEYQDVIGSSQSPYVNSLTARGGVAVSDFAIRHPSLPNYLALIGGSTFGIDSDCTDCHVSAPNLVDQLEAAGVSWKAYLEGAPTPCFRGSDSALGYVKKHNPFIYFDDIATRPARCARLVPFSQLASDQRAGRLPRFVWISPNLCEDTHNCSVSIGDRFLSLVLPGLQRQLGPHGFVIVTWDEGDSDAGCCQLAHGGHVAAIVLGPDVRRGARDPTPVDHYGVLATIESAFGLPPLANAANPASGSLDGLFTRPPRAVR